MDTEEQNPHLATEIPGSWDIAFKKWGIGACVALLMLVWGVEDVHRALCWVPVPVKRGLSWMELSGAGARWFGGVQIAFSCFLHGRYFWRFHDRLWRQYRAVEAGGLALTSVSVIITYIYLWRTYYN